MIRAWYALAMRTYIFSCALFAACAHTPAAQRATATMGNPLRGSDAQPVVFHNRIFHDIYGMPEDAVANRATITSANDNQVCLRVELRRGVIAMPNDRVSERARVGRRRMVLAPRAAAIVR